jgi:Fe-Mn family superoxide dismutase
MSAETFAFHHGKHHKAYVDKVNGWIEEKDLGGMSLVEGDEEGAGERGQAAVQQCRADLEPYVLLELPGGPGQEPTGKLAT